MADRYWDRIRKLVRQLDQQTQKRVPMRPVPVGQPPQVQAPRPSLPTQQLTQPPPTESQAGPLTLSEKMEAIKEAGSQNLLLEVTYNNVTRLVEPYSFRERWSKEANSFKTYFYGWCLLHNETHSFKPELIQAIKITDVRFNPNARGFINEFLS